MMIDILWKDSSLSGDLLDFFASLSRESANAFFNEYIESIDRRINVLHEFLRTNQGEQDTNLDFSPKSLVPLWQCVSKTFAFRDFTDKELSILAELPQWAAAENRAKRKPFSQETLRVINDIAIYFGEVLIRNHPNAKWNVCHSGYPDYIDENQPVVEGFDPVVNPRRIITGKAHRQLTENKFDDYVLSKLYESLSATAKSNQTQNE